MVQVYFGRKKCSETQFLLQLLADHFYIDRTELCLEWAALNCIYYKSQYRNINDIVSVFQVVALITADCERCFSVLQLISAVLRHCLAEISLMNIITLRGHQMFRRLSKNSTPLSSWIRRVGKDIYFLYRVALK